MDRAAAAIALAREVTKGHVRARRTTTGPVRMTADDICQPRNRVIAIVLL